MKILGVVLSSDMIDVYIKQIRSVLELAVPAWHPSLTLEEKITIERVQKTALHIIYQENYQPYKAAYAMANICTLEERRVKLCSKFALRALRSQKFSNWFRRHEPCKRTRLKKPWIHDKIHKMKTRAVEKYKVQYANTERLKK